MNKISFQCDKKILLERLKIFRRILKPGVRKITTLEIRIQPLWITLHITGASEKIHCITDGYGSFTISLEYFYSIVNDTEGTAFSPKFINGEMHIGPIIASGLGFKIYQTHLENKQTPDLALNYTDIDILKIKNEISYLSPTGFDGKKLVDSAERALQSNIAFAHDYLKKYGVTIEDIEEIVEKYVG